MRENGYSYIGDDVSLTLISAGMSTLNSGIGSGQFLKTSNGIWYLDFRAKVVFSAAARSGDFGIQGVTFDQAVLQPLSAWDATSVIIAPDQGFSAGTSTVSANAIFVACNFNGATSSTYTVNGRIKLNARPTAYIPEWVD